MFPEENIDLTVKNLTSAVETSKEVLKSYSFDFDAKEFIVKDGSPVLVDNLEATKQWIQKFLATDLGTLEIYNGFKFGTSYKKMIGSKSLDNGYIESEIEREIREGFLLCPTIKQVTSYESEKVGTKLCLEISVELQGGASLEIESELNE